MIEDAARIRCPRRAEHVETYSRETAREPVVADITTEHLDIAAGAESTSVGAMRTRRSS